MDSRSVDVNPQIFREYDIRGIADRELSNEVVLRLGKGIGTYFRRHGFNHVSVGRDCRLSSPRLREALVQGLRSSGVDVVDIEICPTPLLYYSIYRLELGGGVMITGSHNPADYNGFKITAGKSTLYGDHIQRIRRLLESEDFESGSGSLEVRPLIEEYLNELAEMFGRLTHPPKVVVDCGNGTTSLVASELYRRMGCEVVTLFGDLDGRFPNHHPDPTVPENLNHLIREVQMQSADVGFAFDGDGDRIGVVDEAGRIVWGDHLMILYSRSILRDRPGATVIADVKCSQNLFDEVRRLGGKPIMWRTGHSLIKAKMREEGAPLAGEMSGHMFFADRYYGFDDATFAGARVLEILSQENRSLSELLADVPRTVATPEIRIDCPEELKFKVVEQARRYFSERYDTVTVDGVRIIFEDGWGLIRASNTGPLLVLRFEAETGERLGEIRALIEGRLEDFQRLAAAS